MSPTHDEVLAQLEDELGDRLCALAAAGGTGDDLIDAERRAVANAKRLLFPLLSTDQREAAQAVVDLMCALWPAGTEPPKEWWRTPLGRVAARSFVAGDDATVSHREAAAMLGVPYPTVSSWASRGQIAKHPDGSILRSAVMERLAADTVEP